MDFLGKTVVTNKIFSTISGTHNLYNNSSPISITDEQLIKSSHEPTLNLSNTINSDNNPYPRKQRHRSHNIFPPANRHPNRNNLLINSFKYREHNLDNNPSVRLGENFISKIERNNSYIKSEKRSILNKINEDPINKSISINTSNYIYTPVKFWVEEPLILFQTLEVIPRDEMTIAERLNAMTRVIIIIAAIMFIVKFPLWWLFLIFGLIVVVVMWYLIKEKDNIRQREYLRSVNKPRKQIIQQINNEPLGKCRNVHNQQLNIISLH